MCSGSADSSSSIVTTVAVCGTSPSGASPPTWAVWTASSGARCSTEVTLPTFTPAIRTGEAGLTLPAFANTAWTEYLSAHGSVLVNA